MRFLVEDWLVDVNCDFAGKCVFVSLACTIIQRLLCQHPILSVTAGKGGGGKTTAIQMSFTALTGKEAPAAWSTNPEERRKSIFAYAREGVAGIVFDNIANGTLISDATIERICTAPSLFDRVLRLSKNEDVATDAVLNFTRCISTVCLSSSGHRPAP